LQVLIGIVDAQLLKAGKNRIKFCNQVHIWNELIYIINFQLILCSAHYIIITQNALICMQLKTKHKI
jgi:hypothetical protein